jgi:hypothetical protein
MNKNLFILIALLSACFTACMNDNELERSIFIYDPEDMNLPAYSEWGYNTFGAYYDRDIFISSNGLIPAKIGVSDTSMTYMLNGQLGHLDEYYFYHDMEVSFTLSGFIPAKYEDLAALNDSVIDLSDPHCQVTITVDNSKETVKILEGGLHFKRVQILYVDERKVEAILSGYFDFKAIVSDKPVTISDGRFDVGISHDNFYVQ